MNGDFILSNIDGYKIQSLKKALGCSRCEAIGIAFQFLSFALKNADSYGSIVSYGYDDILEAVGTMCSDCTRTPDEIVEALISSNIVTLKNGAYYIVDYGKRADVGYSQDFEDFWCIYPRKTDKATAYRKYKARLKEGFSALELKGAAASYADECRRKNTEEKFIKHDSTFLGSSKPFEEYLAQQIDVQELDYERNPFE